jgi:hypothetical protein
MNIYCSTDIEPLKERFNLIKLLAPISDTYAHYSIKK